MEDVTDISCINLDSYLVPTYISAIPSDPQAVGTSTTYQIAINPTSLTPELTAPNSTEYELEPVQLGTTTLSATEEDYSCGNPTLAECWSAEASSTMAWGPNPSTPGVSTDENADNSESNQQQVIDNHWDGNPYTSSNYPAFAYCEQLTEGYPAGTWYLPSINQLKTGLEEQFVNGGSVGFGESTDYWSSTESSSIYAWDAYYYGDVFTSNYYKDRSNNSVRCLR